MKTRGEGRDALLDAARLEFEELGFEATHSNAIAKRAGYAPQTFYRHFLDKRAIFIAVYEDWLAAESRLLANAKTPQAITKLLIEHHKAHRRFRLSLRSLSVTDAEIGAARAQARSEQVQAIGALMHKPDAAAILASIFKVERLCDAIADGEFQAVGVSERKAREQVLRAVLELYAQVRN
jgi:AcrR family transcriptional regulator